MSAPETQARQSLMGLLATTFAAERFDIRDDKLHASVGGDTPTVLGCYTDRSERGANPQVNMMYIVVQFYGTWRKVIDNEEVVSPSIIEDYADRFRNALRGADPNTSGVWYFDLQRISFPDDPTGNKTRFEAVVLARGNNGAQLSETTG